MDNSKKCDTCINGWKHISENEYSTKCTLNREKCTECLMGTKSHYVKITVTRWLYEQMRKALNKTLFSLHIRKIHISTQSQPPKWIKRYFKDAVMEDMKIYYEERGYK